VKFTPTLARKVEEMSGAHTGVAFSSRCLRRFGILIFASLRGEIFERLVALLINCRTCPKVLDEYLELGAF